MTRADMVREILRLEGLAHAATLAAVDLRTQLADLARAEYTEHGTAPSWRLPGIGSVVLPISQEAPVVANERALVAWLQERHPDAVEVKPRPSSVTALKRRLRCDGDLVVIADTGEIVPGMTVRPGGEPKSLTITAEKEITAAYLALGAGLLEELEAMGRAEADDA